MTCATVSQAAAGAAGERAAPASQMPAQSMRLSDDASHLLDTILAAHDQQGRPFAIVDKKMARVHVFGGDGSLKASSPVLLGLAEGDDSVPGIGERPMAAIKPEERTTPAGRFEAEPGRNSHGEDIIWVDYDAAVSMHRVRTANKADRRLHRLATPTIADNRISYGCINVPAAFYDAYLRDSLGKANGMVYVLPETRPLDAQFGALLKSSSRADARRGS
ncbi:MAG: L,D-transpeptidase [Gammaproteobacteria bacterium]|nr:L,D-transpeptidase [Gammaproteobacteria bacterium]MBU1444237.1 L,D-transpeptidase [Gammaproteobacteria bacterium]MBU2285979.1 L,D-transpeptidase [Gammaproteobacteria bacterium]MBU2407979.1 L,D-transpeptidase [Gammaproteobacteria bacterium]